MFDIDRWLEIWASIKSNLLRTFLSGFTIALALFVFITLFGLSNGLQKGFEEEFFPPGVKKVSLYTGKTNIAYRGKQKGREVELKLDDYYYIKEKYGDQILSITPSITKEISARYGSEYGSYMIQGVLPSQQQMAENTVISGRYINEEDGRNLEKNVTIGRLVEKDLYKNESAVGRTIQLGNTLYHVVGVFSDEDGDDEERKIYLPIQTMQVIYGTDKIDRVDYLPAEDLTLAGIKELSSAVEQDLKSIHQVSPEDLRGLRVRDNTDGLEQTELFFYLFAVIVFVIGGGSLIAGVVSISNMMAYSVRERTKEIGVRKALGATPKSIIALVLQETLTVTFIFGFIGVLSGVLLTNSVDDQLTQYLIYDPSVEKRVIIMAVVILFLAGLIAGFLPARRAANIKPIEALRDD
ncbi:FtsX-like permease family protein [Flavobacteriaceae bacterium Ap0902]|nr:FtsX-like permease family protein [Flavobacteriaceae bacterium Ap0902]